MGACVGSRLSRDLVDAATGQPLPWPATEALTLKFVAHHLWDPVEARDRPPTWDACRRRRGLADEGAAALRWPPVPRTPSSGASASWSTLHRWKGIDGPFAAPSLRAALRLAVRALAAAARAQEQGRHPGRLGSVDRNLRDGSSSRYPGSRHPPLGVCVRRASAQRSDGMAVRRAAEG